MVGFRLHKTRNLRRVEDPVLGHAGGFEGEQPVGVLLPLRSALTVSGEPPDLAEPGSFPVLPALAPTDDIRETDFAPRQVLLASRATR